MISLNIIMKEKKLESHSINLPSDYLSLLDSVICKVEVDLTGWLSDLSGRKIGKFGQSLRMIIM